MNESKDESPPSTEELINKKFPYKDDKWRLNMFDLVNAPEKNIRCDVCKYYQEYKFIVICQVLFAIVSTVVAMFLAGIRTGYSEEYFNQTNNSTLTESNIHKLNYGERIARTFNGQGIYSGTGDTKVPNINTWILYSVSILLTLCLLVVYAASRLVGFYSPSSRQG